MPLLPQARKKLRSTHKGKTQRRKIAGKAKVKMQSFTIQTKKKYELVDITQQIKKAIKETKVKEGIVNVFVPHATAAIAINENYDPNVCLDILDALDKLIPEGKWRHDRIDNNAAAHIKAAIIGPSENIPIQNGELMLGTWQACMLCEFDGPRERKVYVKVCKN